MKILLVADVNGWIWETKSKALKKHINHDIDIVFTHGHPRFDISLLDKYDHIHLFPWYDIPFQGYKAYLHKISTTIAHHEFETINLEKAKEVLPHINAIVAVSPFIYTRLKELGFGKNVYRCYNGVETEQFTPPGCRNNKKLVVGWVGKPLQNNLDLHGARVKDLINQKLLEYPEIEFQYIQANYRNAKPYKTMPEYYKSLDVFIHTGSGTGTPNPAFEAASSGCAIIGTKSACLTELINESENGYLINRLIKYTDTKDEARCANDFVEKLVYLSNNRELCKQMGAKSREIVEKEWQWKDRAQAYIPVFENHK